MKFLVSLLHMKPTRVFVALGKDANSGVLKDCKVILGMIVHCCILMCRMTLKSHSTICVLLRAINKHMWDSCKRDTKNVTKWAPNLWNMYSGPYIICNHNLSIKTML